MSHAVHLTKTERRQVEAAVAEFDRWGLAWSICAAHPGHKKLKVTGPAGGEFHIVIACTPRDADAAANLAAQNARRLIRDINQRAGIYG